MADVSIKLKDTKTIVESVRRVENLDEVLPVNGTSLTLSYETEDGTIIEATHRTGEWWLTFSDGVEEEEDDE
jgi:hypothetical protein